MHADSFFDDDEPGEPAVHPDHSLPQPPIQTCLYCGADTAEEWEAPCREGYWFKRGVSEGLSRGLELAKEHAQLRDDPARDSDEGGEFWAIDWSAADEAVAKECDW